ncbi:hypothetical protein HOLleu_05214 [Holothuria leucospilota]|uniref:Uncharacterized protein n=1 Tax=Holothuria leucospilota TaxID=206669 RepID=A0A9Q1CJJ1_HOLLE|nr:hypothetical protein HOLleu_05214 [Holothuria leucospilota]
MLETTSIPVEEVSKTGTFQSLVKQRNDIKVQSHKKTIRHTVRAKKLDERQLFKFLKSLEESKAKRLLQIDKEVAEVEETLGKLLDDQNEVNFVKRSQKAGKSAFTTPETTRSEKKRRRKTKNVHAYDEGIPSSNRLFSRIDTSTRRVDKLLDSYYRFDEYGNRLQISPLLSSAASSGNRTEHGARVAWDISDLTASDLRTISANSDSVERASQSSSMVRAKMSSNVDSGSVSSRKESARERLSSQRKDQNEFTNEGPEISAGSPVTSKRLLVSPQRNVIRKSGIIKVPALFIEELTTSSTPVSKEDTSEELLSNTESEGEISLGEGEDTSAAHLPARFELGSDFSPTFHMVNHVTRNSPHVCNIPDCIFHDKSLRRNQTERPNMLDVYYRTSINSRAKQTGTPIILPVFQSSSDVRKTALSARRTALSPPSPTPSEIIQDIVYTPKNTFDSMNNTDLEVVRSVRRPMKGSNREQMLKDKEANVRHTFDLMRQKMSAKVPPDFNTNYGTPTPNWKILNPLKLRHKINHSSPLHRMWKQ